MSESLSNNANDNQENNKPDAVELPNGTTLLAVKDEEGAQVERDETPIEEQPKGDLKKILSNQDNTSTSIPDGNDEDIIRSDVNETEQNGSGVFIDQADPSITDTSNLDNPTSNEANLLPTPTITEPPLPETHSSHPSPSIRAATPSSRTSTPPLGSSALAKKKFSSVNVNSKFLSKAGSPAPTAGPTKISSLNGRPAASPVPIASSSSRLLSTKLTTVPSSKTSTSPNPPSSAASSPWAKPVLPLPAEPSPAPSPISTTTTTLHQPAPTRARVLGTTTTPTMGAGLVSAMVPPKPAWKSVTGESRKPGLGISRDFPTAKEVAEGKKAAQMAAQAQAAHNQAILQELNTFTTLDPGTHRWDEEDEDDDVIDFGDGSGEHPHHDGESAIHEVPLNHQPVSKSERFAEDFDRSWPRRQLPPVEGNQTNRRQDADNSRVLFNASSNRLENSRQPPPQIQPTRLMSRPTDTSGRQQPPHLANGGDSDRPLPPHLQAGDRMLPPHMSNVPPTEARSQPGPSAAPPPARSAWNIPKDSERPLPPHLSGRRELPPQSAAFGQSRYPQKPLTNLPPRRSFSQASAPAPSEIQHVIAEQPATSPTIGVDAQTAEMHTAAEKAKARRLAEEAEREAAAERARRKAKELEERFKGTHSTEGRPAPPPAVISAPEAPQITLAQRPRPPMAEQPNQSGLPPRPEASDQQNNRSVESSWRSRAQAAPSQAEPAQPTPHFAVPSAAVNHKTTRPTAESFFEDGEGEESKVSISPAHDAAAPKKEAIFDNMLARIQAAMAEARATPAAASVPAEQSPEQSAQSPEVTTIQPRPAIIATRPEQLKPALIVVQQYFDVSYPEPPKSPPPAWRTYTIKLPKTQPSRSPVPRARLNAAEGPRTPSPHGWIMSFNPPLEGVNPSSLSRSDLLLPQPVLRRFQRPETVISISPRQLEPFEKKIKKKPSIIEAARTTAELPTTSAESLLPAPTTLKSQCLRDQRNRTDDWRQPESSASSEKAISQFAEETTKIEPPPRKTKSPVKTSAAAKAEREGRFMFDGVTIGAPEKERMLASDKPGVRFMVSSELEGDSLLDEVNKMSLETLGDDEKAQHDEASEPSKVSNVETPITPPLPRPASPNTSTWPSTSLSYPASHSPARTSSQHDHSALKSVWEDQQAATKQSSDLNAAAPMYPSLNAPSSADPPAAQPLPGAMKMAFSNSQTFSSPGTAPPATSANPFGSLRPSPATHSATHSQYGQFSSPSPDNPNHHMVGMNYTSMANPRTGTNGFQQGVWSPTAFGTSMASPGYGYTTVPKSSISIDQKSPVTMGYSNSKSPEAMMYSGYSTTVPTGYSQQQYANAQAAYGGRGGQMNQSMYYSYGAPGTQGQQSQGIRAQQQQQQQQQQSRFAQSNGEYSTHAQQQIQQAQSPQIQQYNIDQGGYYGGLSGAHHQQQQQQAMYASNGTLYGHQTHGAVGQTQNSRGGMGSTRKMW
ncbi:uncharacterized protein L201_006316 [Kwoniella dendrophila CBS 6074]|uniref:Uncharacterized protein n=1 Tax=Kwoniella dendrophila CBS 6074 TaxID=1295534 RepID=A0AAX4K2H3_9TREE